MAGTTRYARAKDLIDELSNESTAISYGELNSEIIKNLSGNPKVIREYIKLMIDTKLIRDVGNYNYRFEDGTE